ncbi:hypothetical protein BCR33DRAFT_737670 [Rhizoclosmatium globosum]|uniref:ADP-ribosylglycohydrolase n=1 Tax=Rhizoclosmatium globosum TaxID=329046 RepID=A0A1Y2CEL1_9FUNG|nr:hypothetical protein BCR33DRAFT_737670 [Rhizoclosmatium globosum]|eukprot:ORY45327.1 hypothetical protein BCR33DRAFT_737670 [Rhizoclosmatium globosum]
MPERASVLGKAELRSRVRGLVLGCGLSDALGLATEFMTKTEATRAHPLSAPIKFDQFVRDRHRIRWAEADFTDDTDQLIVLLTSIGTCEGRVDVHHFGGALKTWATVGLPLLNKLPYGLGMIVGRALRSPNFDADPHLAAFVVWLTSICSLAANGAVMRTAITGVPFFGILRLS